MNPVICSAIIIRFNLKLLLTKNVSLPIIGIWVVKKKKKQKNISNFQKLGSDILIIVRVNWNTFLHQCKNNN